jgi:hypothetical protein
MLRNLFIVGIAITLSACGGSGAVKNSTDSDLPRGSSSLVSVSSIKSLPSSAASSVVANASLSASSEAGEPAVDNIYGLYVSLHMGRNDQLLGNAQREEQFIKFVRDGGFNYLIFYELEGLNSTSTKARQFASLVSRAKLTASVTQVAAALGGADEADAVVAYNAGRPASERIDVLNVEYEFWNKKDRKTEFSNTISMLERFKTVALANQLQTEIYIGWIDAAEAVSLANVTDRILVHFYRQTDVDIVNFGIERLEWLAAASRKVKIAPIFSSEGPNNTYDLPFMGCWLETNSHQQAYASWKSQYDAIEKPWKENIDVVGATWFIYDKFLDVNNVNGQQSSSAVSNGCGI